MESQLARKGYDTVVVTESHPDDTILDAELFPSNYVIYYRKDRNRKGGVVLLAVGDEILSTRRNCDPNSELLWVDIYMGKQIIYIWSFLPAAKNLIEPLVDLSASLDEFYDSAEIVLVGDFNPSDIDWSTTFVLRDPDANCRLMDILLHHLCHNRCWNLLAEKNI